MSTEVIIEKKTLLYLCGYIALLLKDLVRASNLAGELSVAPRLEDLLTVAGIVLMLDVFIQTPVTLQEFFYIMVILAVAAITYLNNAYFYVISSALCVICCRGINFKQVIAVSYRVKAVWIFIHVFAYVMTYILAPDRISYTYRGTTLRHYFFLSQANTAAMLLTWTMIEFLYLNYERLNTFQYLGIWLIFSVYNYFTDSRTSIYILSITILLFWLHRTGYLRERPVRWCAKYGIAICSVLFPMLALGYLLWDTNFVAFFSTLDTVLTGRIRYGAFGIDTYGFTFLGQVNVLSSTVYWKGTWIDNIVFDNAYIDYAVALGIIWLIILSYGFLRVEKWLSVAECIVVIAYVLFSITENYTVNAVECFPLIFLSRLLYGSYGGDRTEAEEDIPLMETDAA